MRITSRGLVASLTAVGVALALASPAAARTIEVQPGQSIQAAIDAAHPGDLVVVENGTYFQSLLINKDRIRLRGEHVTLRQPASPPSNFCNSPGAVVGICIGDATNASNGPVANSTVSHVRVSGFTIRGFSGDGMFIFGADGTNVLHMHLFRNGGYGAFSNTSTTTHFLENVVRDNNAPGLYVGDSQPAKATVRGNVITGNSGAGVFLRDVTSGFVRHNVVRGNCIGIWVLADAPGPAGSWTISRNSVSSNNKACAGDPGEGLPPLSGLGIVLSGANHTSVVGNRVTNHRHVNPSPFTGGILVLKGDKTPPKAILVKDNTATANSPFDIRWDLTGSDVDITRNNCDRGSPSVVCQ